MAYYYEFIRPENELPVKAVIHSFSQSELHWHKQMEMTMVLEGTLKIRIGQDIHVLKTGDVVFMNSQEIHNVFMIAEPNLLLQVLINPEFYREMYLNFANLYMDCNSVLLHESNEPLRNKVRKYLAQVVWELNTQQLGFRSRLASSLYLLTGELFSVSPFYKKEDMDINSDSDLNRLQRIIEYIDMNLDKKITLKDIGAVEHLNYHYLSHFIKEKLGMSFQEYLNQARLNKAISLLLYSNKSNMEIAAALGYANVTALNKLFKQELGLTPSEYVRLTYQHHATQKIDKPEMRLKDGSQLKNINIFPAPEPADKFTSRNYLDVEHSSVLESLFAYLEKDQALPANNENAVTETIHMEIDANKAGDRWEPYRRKLISCTPSAQELKMEWESQLQEIQNEIAWEQVRLPDIFSDIRVNYPNHPEGEISYNWDHIDDLIDNLLENNIKPFIQLGFKTDFKNREGTAIGSPKAVIKAFIRHLINRYSLEAVATWYFAIENQAVLKNYPEVGEKEDYFRFYKIAVLTIKAISSNIKVGGSAMAYSAVKDNSCLEAFLLYCYTEHLPLDFMSLHLYPKECLNPSQALEQACFPIEQILGYKPELYINGWSLADSRSLIYDTAYAAPFIIYNIISCSGLTASLTYGTFTDITEETSGEVVPFYGNVGLINKDGIKKPAYFAYCLLNKLGDTILEKGAGYIVTKDNTGVQILAYNLAGFDDAFMAGDTSRLSHTDRYEIYENKLTQEMKLKISGLEGKHKITRYALNRQHGSAYDKWLEMGAPQEMTPEAIKYLKNNNYPKMTIENVVLEGEYNGTIALPVHGVELVEIKKVRGKA